MFEGSKVRTVIFDLDGTLVETEHLKAQAYAHLIGDLTGIGSPELEAVSLYRSNVGATDMTICALMVRQFGLARLLDREDGESPEQSLHHQRMALYRRSYGTAKNLVASAYAHNINLARLAAREGLAIGVATMSYSDEAMRVVKAIGLSDAVKTVVGVDDVAQPKPAPDAFVLAMDRLGASPENTLIIEDSPRGALAAMASGAHWVCVATEFSYEALRSDGRIDAEWVVWDPADLEQVVSRRIFN